MRKKVYKGRYLGYTAFVRWKKGGEISIYRDLKRRNMRSVENYLRDMGLIVVKVFEGKVGFDTLKEWLKEHRSGALLLILYIPCL